MHVPPFVAFCCNCFESLAELLRFLFVFFAGALHRAEWIKFTSLFFNLEATANRLYDELTDRWQCHKRYVSRNAEAEGSKPVVAWLNKNDYSSPPVWEIKKPAYMVELTEAAGASPLVLETNTFAVRTTSHGLLDVVVLSRLSFCLFLLFVGT